MSSQQKTSFIILSTLCAIFWMGGIRVSHAIQDDPFGDPFGGGAGAKKQQKNDDPFGGADDPFGGGPAKSTPKASKKGPSAVPTPQGTDKVVLAIRETNPTTPSDFMQALRIMFDTQNFNEAKSYLAKIEAANISDAVAFSLVEEIGSDFLYRLMRSEQMAPQGAVFGRKMLASSSKHLKSDANLQSYFNDIASTSPSKRNVAARGFRRAGEDGLAFMVKNVGSIPADQQSNYEITAALIGNSIRLPLEAVLESGTDAQKAFAMAVLGRANLRKSIPFLLSPLFEAGVADQVKTSAEATFKRMLGGVPGKAEAKRFLSRQLDELIKGGRPFDVDAAGTAAHWVWTNDGKLMDSRVPPQVARVLLMEKLSQALYGIDTEDAESKKVFLACQLTTIKTLQKKSVTESINTGALSAVDVKEWMEVLEFCMENKLLAGAAAAAEIIGKVGDESVMKTSEFNPLVKAMEMGDRDLRFACTEAMINLNPTRSFPGASRFMDSVVYFAGTKGYARAMVAHPKFSEGQNLVGTLAERGFAATAVTTGRDLFRRASQDSDLQFILISDAIDLPNLGELLVQLRSQPSLSRIPIGILSQKINHEKNVRIASTDPMVYVMKQPYRVSFRVEQLLPADNAKVNNAIITWSVLSDILEQALEQKNRTVAIQMLDTMREAYDDDLSKLAVDNSAIIDAMKYSEGSIRNRASKLFLRVTGEKPLYEKAIEQPTTSGRVLIVHPKAGEIAPLQELLKEVGYTVAVMDTVESAVKVIPNIPSLRFVISSKELGGLAAEELNKALSKKFRLNPIPTTFVARSDSYREAPVAKPVFDSQLQQLLKLSHGVGPSAADRVSQAKTCLGFLGKVLADRKSYAFADPIRHESKIISCLQNPALTAESLGVLGELATPAAQQAIVNFASENTRPVADRNAAVQAFAKAIKKRGILLTKVEILEQYARYNKSEALDAETQKVLGSILDVIEAPRQ